MSPLARLTVTRSGPRRTSVGPSSVASAWRAGLGAAIAAALAWAPATHAADATTELDRLRAENARLQERVRTLEVERDRAIERCPPPVAEAMQRAASERVSVRTDDTGDGMVATTERSRLERTTGGHSKHWLTVRARGRNGVVEAAWLVIDADASGGVYRGLRSAMLRVDGRSDEVAVSNYQEAQLTTAARTPRAAGVAESVTLAVPPATLARLADAREVTGTLGPTTFRLTAEQLLALRAMRQRLSAK